MQDKISTDTKKSNKLRPHKRLLIVLVSFVLFMCVFTYLLVPIFTFVCKQVGINGKNGLSATPAAIGMTADQTRTIKVQFTSVLHGNFKFQFKPMEPEITIHPGERRTIYFYAENDTGVGKTVQAVPSITPIDAARFLKKIECFCFTQQHFDKNEKAKMFVNFYIDPDISKDIKEITLAYTLFDATGYEGKIKPATKGRIKL